MFSCTFYPLSILLFIGSDWLGSPLVCCGFVVTRCLRWNQVPIMVTTRSQKHAFLCAKADRLRDRLIELGILKRRKGTIIWYWLDNKPRLLTQQSVWTRYSYLRGINFSRVGPIQAGLCFVACIHPLEERCPQACAVSMEADVKPDVIFARQWCRHACQLWNTDPYVCSAEL